MTPAEGDALLELAVGLAHEAGDMLLSLLGTARVAATKSSPTDAVTELDRASEALIIGGLRRARPDDAIVGEEGTADTGTTGLRWVVDPLDGTVNYLYGHPSAWSVSIAAEDATGGLVGVVYDPSRAETFTACRGMGAHLNQHPIAVSAVDSLAAALVGTGFSYSAADRARQAEVLTRVLPAVRDVRRAGSAALDLCWVGCSRLDGYYERGVRHWDWAAGAVIVAEAGGTFTIDGSRLAIAGPSLVHSALVDLVGMPGVLTTG